jgi:hypothetical protein
LDDIVPGVVASLVALGAQSAAHLIVTLITRLRVDIPGRSVSGTWICFYMKDHYQYVDIFRFKQSDVDLKLRCWHFANWHEKRSGYLYKGLGVKVDAFVSAYYCSSDRTTPETGCYVLG